MIIDKIRYNFYEGDKEIPKQKTVRVSKRIADEIKESRRLEHNLVNMEHYHCRPLFDENDKLIEIADERDPYCVYTQEQRDREIRDFIDSLTEIQRRRVELRMEGKSITEIAEMEGVGYNKVKKSLEQVGVRYLKEMK